MLECVYEREKLREGLGRGSAVQHAGGAHAAFGDGPVMLLTNLPEFTLFRGRCKRVKISSHRAPYRTPSHKCATHSGLKHRSPSAHP